MRLVVVAYCESVCFTSIRFPCTHQRPRDLEVARDGLRIVTNKLPKSLKVNESVSKKLEVGLTQIAKVDISSITGSGEVKR